MYTLRKASATSTCSFQPVPKGFARKKGHNHFVNPYFTPIWEVNFEVDECSTQFRVYRDIKLSRDIIHAVGKMFHTYTSVHWLLICCSIVIVLHECVL